MCNRTRSRPTARATSVDRFRVLLSASVLQWPSFSRQSCARDEGRSALRADIKLLATPAAERHPSFERPLKGGEWAHSPPSKGGEAAQRPGWLVIRRVASLCAKSLKVLNSHRVLAVITSNGYFKASQQMA